MKYSNCAKVSAMIAKLVKDGWEFEPAGRGRHAKIITPTGYKAPVPGSPSDHRAFLNFRTRMRRLGGNV